MAKGKDKSGRLSVFKGREARLNGAIFHILAHRGPLTIYDIYQQIRIQRGLLSTRYASVNRRVRLLEESGYVSRAGMKKTKAGFETTTFRLTARACLSMLLNFIDLDDTVKMLDEDSALTVMAEVINGVLLASKLART